MTSLERLNDELNRLFDLFNSEYYGGQLRKPVIAVQTNDKKEKSRLWQLFNVQDRFCPFAGGGSECAAALRSASACAAANLSFIESLAGCSGAGGFAVNSVFFSCMAVYSAHLVSSKEKSQLFTTSP